MRSHVQTTIETDSATVLILSKKSVFCTQLFHALKALHLQPVFLDIETLSDTLLHKSARDLFSSAYMCLWIDAPVFCNQREKMIESSKVLDLCASVLHVPLIFVSFDASSAYKNGTEGRGPLFASDWLQRAVQGGFAQSRVASYQHVLYPYEGGLSVVMRLLLEQFQSGVYPVYDGAISPLWYGDVITHLLSLVCSPSSPGGVFCGQTEIQIHEFEQKLLEKVQKSVEKGRGRLPFLFPPGIRIGTTSLTRIIEEFSLIVPRPKQNPALDVVIQKPMFVSKTLKRKKQSIRSLVARFLVTASCAYGLFCITYLGIFFQTRTKLQELALYPGTIYQNSLLTTLTRNTRFLAFCTKYIPFPHMVFGVSVDAARILDGIQTLGEVSSTITRYQTAKNALFFAKDWSVGEGVFDESFSKLSFVQSSLNSGDLTLDMVFGIDGMAKTMATKIQSLRDQIAKERVFATVYPSFVGKEKQSYIAFVSFSNKTSRPLFGLPTSITFVELQNGHITSSEQVRVDELQSTLHGVVTPPLEMKNILGLTNWTTALGAWSVDGGTALRELLWLLTKETRKPIDAIVAYPDSIGHDTQTLPTQLRSVGGDVIGSILGSATLGEYDNLLLFDAMFSNFQSGQVVMYAKDQFVQKNIEALWFDGKLHSPVCPTQFSVDSDCHISTRYLGVYDLSPVVHPTTKIQKHVVQITPESVTHTDTTEFDAGSGVVGKKLLKYAIDTSARLISISIDDALVPSSGYVESTEFDKKILTLLVDDTQSQKKIIRFVYDTPGVAKENASFVFFAQKQLADESRFTLDVRFPKEYTASMIAPQAVVSPDRIVFPGDTQKSELFAVGF